MAKKRSGWVIALIILGVIVLLCVVSVIVLALLGVSWIKTNEQSFRDTGSEAAEFVAQGHSQSDCIDEGFRRHDQCGRGMEITCRTRTRLFLDQCLRQATETPGLCDDVPGPMEIMRSAAWQVNYCRSHGRASDQHCSNLVRAVVDFCGRR